MNNKRAIELLHRLQDEQFDGIHGDERREALEMAVRALEPNLGQKTIDYIIKRLNDEERITGDTIYRQDAIDCVSEMLKGIFVEHEDIAKKAIGKLPSAQPQWKKGKWLDGKGNVKIVGYGAYCSCCKRESEYVTNYCPNCGADMRGEIDG